jgi:hypothetical protein
VTLFLTYHEKNHLVTQIKHVVPSLPKDQNVRACRQVELNLSLFECHQTARVHLVRRGCVLAYWLAYALHQVPQIERVDLIFDIVDFDDITRMQCREKIGLLTIADTMSRIDLSCTWACEWPLHMKDVIHADGWWQWASSAGLPAQTKRWCLRMARCIRDPTLDAAALVVGPRVPPRDEPTIRRLAAHH